MRSAIAKPSSLLHGIQIERVEDLDLFKFTDALQSRMEELLDKKKANAIAPEEQQELESIGELDRIFTYINAMLAARQ